jgi:hypothetical protein
MKPTRVVKSRKPKQLVKVRHRADRGKWEVDFFNPPGIIPARERPLFDSEEEATEQVTRTPRKW